MKIRANKKLKRTVWQHHHLWYGKPEKKDQLVWVRKSEHYYITLLQRFSSLTPGAKKAIRYICRTKPDCKERRDRRESKKD